MFVAANDKPTIDKYIGGVMKRVTHHAKHVEKIIPALRGFIETYGHDLNVFAQNGDMKNVMWFKSNKTGTIYYFRHDYGVCVELRQRNRKGAIIATFDNNSTVDDLWKVFSTI